MRFKSVMLMAGMVLLIASVAALGCGKDKQAQQEMSMTSANCTTASFKVTGMHCGNCAAHVRETLSKVEGVQNVIVSFEDSRAIVEYNPEKVNADQLLTTAQTTGFTVVKEVTDQTKLSSEKACDMSAKACPHATGQMTSGQGKACCSDKKTKKGST
jgi:copper chaperone CopZ